jgi:periplasmic protein TonB
MAIVLRLQLHPAIRVQTRYDGRHAQVSMDASNRIFRFPEPPTREPLGAARDDATGSDTAPPVVLRVDNVVSFEAVRSDSAARRPVIAATRDALPRRRPERLRWPACLALALVFHAAVAAALLRYWHPDQEQVAGAPLILIELAPLPEAPAATPTQAPPGPQQTQTAAAPPSEKLVEKSVAKPEPEPEQPAETTETVTIPPTPQAEQPMPVLPPPKPIDKPAEKPQPKKHTPSPAQQASAPSAAAHRAARAAAPAPGASTGNPYAVSNWKSRLVARLERYKRTPTEAQARGEHGVARLAFSVDRAGGVYNAHIVRSSGSTTLDGATLALVARAQPLPPPPPEIRGGRIAITVSIRYNIR